MTVSAAIKKRPVSTGCRWWNNLSDDILFPSKSQSLFFVRIAKLGLKKVTQGRWAGLFLFLVVIHASFARGIGQGLNGKADLAILGGNIDDFGLKSVADIIHAHRGVDLVSANFRNMDQTLNTLLYLNKDTEIGNVGDGTINFGSFRIPERNMPNLARLSKGRLKNGPLEC